MTTRLKYFCSTCGAARESRIEFYPNSDAISQALDHSSTLCRRTGEIHAARAIATRAAVTIDIVVSDFSGR